ncbi:HGL191Cp [Eremothecium sinecaudum]|uniref:HGL191Cp n=1 Tax=Eremothecium sinecaudum TaxID=45286 RepID=A0A0X8HVF5_9SACH|nr:HGL191Cp [Eremothecium sinecaudum]AMD22149.1 HGL191Cp [Eremothecium sinecaudum]
MTNSPSSKYLQQDLEQRQNLTQSKDATPETGALNFDENGETIERIRTGGKNNEYIFIGRQKFLRSDLYEAFGGTLNPGLAPAPTHKFANPAPLGLSAFALTTFILSMFNCSVRGIGAPNVVVSVAIFYGGFVQLCAGMWEIVMENTFGAAALGSFGGFWLSYGAINIPWFGILDAYDGRPDELRNALGIYLLAWSLFTFMLTMCTVKSTAAFFSMFLMLAVTFLILAISEFTGSAACKKAGGVLGIIVAFMAWYNAYAGIATKENSYLLAHPISLPTNDRSW